MAETENASLTSIELLSDLPAKALENLSKRCSWRKFQINGQVIDRQSGSCVLCFIVKGRARVVNYSLSGREVTFDDRKGGACFGELAALDGEPRPANIVALEETVVASLSHEVFLICRTTFRKSRYASQGTLRRSCEFRQTGSMTLA